MCPSPNPVFDLQPIAGSFTRTPARIPFKLSFVPAPAVDTRKLLTVLGVTFGLSVTIGNTIGAGILRTPGTIAGQLPSF